MRNWICRRCSRHAATLIACAWMALICAIHFSTPAFAHSSERLGISLTARWSRIRSSYPETTPSRAGPKAYTAAGHCSGAMALFGRWCYAVVIRSNTPAGSWRLACRKWMPIGSQALFPKPKQRCLKQGALCFHFSKVSCLPKAITLDQLGTITTLINNLISEDPSCPRSSNLYARLRC